MNKPIEEKVKLIVENNEYLTLKEKSDIICLIECYKGADQTAQKLAKENQDLKNQLSFYELEMEMETGDYYD